MYKDASVLKVNELRNKGLVLTAWVPAIHYIPVTALWYTTPFNTPIIITLYYFLLSSNFFNYRFFKLDKYITY